MNSNCFLVADDSTFARMVIMDAVSSINKSAMFEQAVSGLEVMKKLSGNPEMGWFLLDINMGKPNGIDTAKELLKRGIDTHRITFITGNKSEEMVQKAKEMGVTCIHKIINPTDRQRFIDDLTQFFNQSPMAVGE